MIKKTTLQKLVEAIKKREVEVYHTTKDGIVISRLDEFLEMEKKELIEAHSEGILFMTGDTMVPQHISKYWFYKKYESKI
jgi:tRNA uridine 5-carbamoylmethylation protein Kti12